VPASAGDRERGVDWTHPGFCNWGLPQPEKIGEREWFNQVDATYKAELRELAEVYYAKFDAKLESAWLSCGRNCSNGCSPSGSAP
jgi:hypothetical protein